MHPSPAEPRDLTARVQAGERRRVAAEHAAGQVGLEVHQDRRWQVADLEVAGRLTHDPDAIGDGPHGVIVDGRFLTWHQLGAALSSFEGWRFRLLIDDPCLDLRT